MLALSRALVRGRCEDAILLRDALEIWGQGERPVSREFARGLEAADRSADVASTATAMRGSEENDTQR